MRSDTALNPFPTTRAAPYRAKSAAPPEGEKPWSVAWGIKCTNTAVKIYAMLP